MWIGRSLALPFLFIFRWGEGRAWERGYPASAIGMLWSILHKAGQHSSYESLISLCTYSYWTILVMLAWSCFVNTLMLSLKHWKVDFWVQVSNSFETLKNHHVRTPDLSSFDSFNAYFIGTKWKIMWCTPSSSDTRQYQHNLCCHMWTYKRTLENCRHFHQTHKLIKLTPGTE